MYIEFNLRTLSLCVLVFTGKERAREDCEASSCKCPGLDSFSMSGLLASSDSHVNFTWSIEEQTNKQAHSILINCTVSLKKATVI